MARLLTTLAVLTLLQTTGSAFVAPNTPSHDRKSSLRRLESSLNDIYVVSWDGVLADTVDYRIRLGKQAASLAWPSLQLQNDDEDWSWLDNKLTALSHVLHANDDGDCSRTCEFALATRLLVEEQELDGGRSNGKTGKYASKYHPRVKEASNDDSKRPTTGTRPLTVSEICVNWNDLLRDTLLTKYHCEYRNPMPVLQEIVDGLVNGNERQDDKRRPQLLPLARDAVKSDSCTVIVLVQHVSDLNVALESLGSTCEVAPDVPDALSCTNLPVVVRTRSTIHDILTSSPTGSTIHVIDSCWESLQREIRLFGDYIPRQGSIGKTVVADRSLSLGLADWSTGPAQQRAATMNAWTHLLSENDFVNRLSSSRTFQ